MLYAAVMNKPLNGETFERSTNGTFAQILADVAGLTEDDIDFFTTTVIEEAPMLAIYVISGDEKYDPLAWDINIEIPKVMANPFDDEDYQTAYDSELNEYLIDEDYIDVDGNALLLVYEDTRYIAIEEGTLTSLEGLTIDHIINSRGGGDPCLPEGMEELCQSFMDAISDMLNSDPDFSDFNEVDRWMMQVSELTTLFVETCCNHNPDGVSENCFDSGEGCDRDSRDEREEFTRVQINKHNRRRFCRFIKTCEFRLTLNTVRNPEEPTPFTLTRFYYAPRKALKWDAIYTFPIDERPSFPRWLRCEWDDYRLYNIIGIHPNAGAEVTLPFTFNPGGFSLEILDGVTVTGPSLSFGFTLTLKATDRDLGTAYWEYCDPANGVGYMSNTGRVKFWLKEIE